MSFIRKHSKLLLVAASCAAMGAGGVIASAGAATSKSSKTGTSHGSRALTPRRWAARAVHGDLTVGSRNGFVTVAFDRGTVHSVSAQQLTLTEGTKNAAYKTVTLTIPTDARVRDNGHEATLADVKSGQRVIVVQAPERTFVIARSARNP